jgi:hypothetical protein
MLFLADEYHAGVHRDCQFGMQTLYQNVELSVVNWKYRAKSGS